jgi:hypothetical protein
MSQSASKSGSEVVTGEIVRQFFGAIEDHTVLAILALRPTIAQLEEAAVRMSGDEEIFAGRGPAGGIVTQIIELVRMEEQAFDEDAPSRRA